MILRSVSAGTLLLLVVLMAFSFGSLAFAQATTPESQLVPCTGLDCQMCHVATLIQRVIRFLIIIAAPIAALLFAYAGVLYFSAAGSENNIGKAKEIFTSAFAGFIIALLAYLLVEVIIRTLVRPEAIGRWNTIQCVGNRLGTTTVTPRATQGGTTGSPATPSTSPSPTSPSSPAPAPQRTQDINDPQPGTGLETGTGPTPKPTPTPSPQPEDGGVVPGGGVLSP